MKKGILILVILFPFALHAQFAGWGRDFILNGEMEIVLKDGSRIHCNDVINGVKNTGNTGLDYRDIDYIFLIKTNVKGYTRYNRTLYKYINFKNKPKLVQVRLESPKLSFYRECPKMTGGAPDALGVFQPHGYTFRTFIVKSGDENASVLVLGKRRQNIPQIFPECKRLIQYQKDKSMRPYLSLEGIIYIYNGNCTEATPQDMENDKKAIKEAEQKSILEKYGYAAEDAAAN